jgi:hypothetical protein
MSIARQAVLYGAAARHLVEAMEYAKAASCPQHIAEGILNMLNQVRALEQSCSERAV